METSPYDIPEVKAHNEAMGYLQNQLPQLHAARYRDLQLERDTTRVPQLRTDIVRILNLQNILDRFRDDPSHYLTPLLRESNAIQIPEISGTIQELSILSDRIFQHIYSNILVETWIQATLSSPGKQTITLQQAQEDWASVDDELRTISPTFNDAGSYHQLAPQHKMPKRITVPFQGRKLAGWTDCTYDPQRGKAAVLKAIQLHEAGGQIIQSREYLSPA